MKRALKESFTTNFVKALLKSLVRSLGISGLIIAAATASALAQKKYDTGATDTELKIGNIMPYSGPASADGVIGKTEDASFKKINAEGGVTGRTTTCISYNAATGPPRTGENTATMVQTRGS